MPSRNEIDLTPDVQADLKMAALGRDVRALGAVWNRTRARLVAEVERLGRLEAALDDDELAASVHSKFHTDIYRKLLRAAMQDAPDQDGKEAGHE